ncbi:MAG: tetratricopeptide repeat protein, partial [Acidobacteriota bacterium]
STSSDVYSLGVVLCKMLTGGLPYGDVPTGTAHWVEAICRREPVRPSVLTTDPAERRQLVGDLDAIVLKALRKEPDQRYASALQLAEDIRRHVEHRPVEAHDGTIFYLTRKLVRRHKLGAALALSIIAFGLVATVLWRTAVEERTRAERSLLRAERVSGFFETLFRQADPNVARGSAPSVRDALDRSRARLLGGELAETPDVRAELLSTLGTVYNDLGYLDAARELKVEAIRVRRAADPSDRPELATDLNNLGRILFDVGDVAAAEQALSEAVAMWGRLGADADGDRITGLRNLAAVSMHRQRYDEAVRYHRDVIALEERFEVDPATRAATLYSLGTVHRLRGDPAAAEPLLRQALEAYRQAHGAVEHTRVAAVQSSLARALHRLGRHAEARSLYEMALGARLRLLGEEHVRVAISRALLAELLLDDVYGGDEVAVAHDHLTAALDVLRRQHDEGVARSATRLATGESIWGVYLFRVGRRDEAESTLEASVRSLRAAAGEDDLATRDAVRRLAAVREAPARPTVEVRASVE